MFLLESTNFTSPYQSINQYRRPPARPVLPHPSLPQLLSSPVMQQRLALVSAAISFRVAGVPPPGFPDGALTQCTTAVAFLQLFVGWLVPTYLAARAEHHAALAVAAEAAAGPAPCPRGASATTSGTTSGSSSWSSSSSATPSSGDWSDGEQGPPLGLDQRRRRQRRRSARPGPGDSLAAWMLRHVFAERLDADARQRVAAWLMLAVLCWLLPAAASMAAVLPTHA